MATGVSAADYAAPSGLPARSDPGSACMVKCPVYPLLMPIHTARGLLRCPFAITRAFGRAKYGWSAR